MKETAPKRCTLKLKFWKEGAEEDALEGIMTTDSLRAARTEFRRKMRALLPYDALSRNLQRDIVQCGYVVAAGHFVNDTDRFAMLLIDQKHLVENPTMVAFTLYDNGHRIQLFEHADGALKSEEDDGDKNEMPVITEENPDKPSASYDYEAIACEEAEECLARADSLISDFLSGEENLDGEVIDEERLVSELDCIHSELGEYDEEGWLGYRDAMDEISNRLWQNGVAWPQQLPYWSWADVVRPEDLKREISQTCLFRDDLLEIRRYADELKCTFKEGVHKLIEHAQATLVEFPKPEPPEPEEDSNGSRKKKSTKRTTAKRR